MEEGGGDGKWDVRCMESTISLGGFCPCDEHGYIRQAVPAFEEGTQRVTQAEDWMLVLKR